MKIENLSVRPEAMERGVRYAVCDKTYQLYGKEPYRQHFAFIEPVEEVPPAEAKPYACGAMRVRQTKGHDYHATTEASQCRDGGNGDCC